MTLLDFFREHPRGALGFSGGVDSSYLLWAAKAAGADIRPYFVKTPFQPEFELRDALALGQMLGFPITVLPYDILPVAGHNPADRCYHCKKAIFGLIKTRAREDGYQLLLDGTNASDDIGDRPGMGALTELSVRSPLRECGLTKDEIRARSREAGLFTWDKPAYACLATRFPTGTEITRDGLSRVEQGENLLFSLGFTDFRVRVFQGAARIQLKQEQFSQAIALREEILHGMKPLFDGVFLDLEGR